LAKLSSPVVVFVVAMAAGMIAYHLWEWEARGSGSVQSFSHIWFGLNGARHRLKR
jgi:hypothetical protein